MATAYYEFDCPNCDEYIEIKKQTPLPKRSCPNCGYAIKLDEVQRQAAERKAEARRQAEQLRRMIRIGVGGAVCLVLVFVGVKYVPAGIKYFFPESEKQEAVKPPENPDKKPVYVAQENTTEDSLKWDVKKDKEDEPKFEPVQVKTEGELKVVPASKDAKKFKGPLPKIEPIENERLKKEQIVSDLNFRLSAIKSLIQQGNPGTALSQAKELVRLHPDSPQAHEAKEIIERIENDR